MIAEALHNLIVNDSLAASLATWEFAGGVPTPAVFTLDTGAPPAGSGRPAIVIEERGGEPWGTRGHTGADVRARVHVFGERTGASVRGLAWQVKELIDRARPALTGYDIIQLIAEPPAREADAAGFPGYRIDVRLLALKQ